MADLDSQLTTITDGIAAINKRLDRIERTTTRTQQTVGNVEDAVSWQTLINDGILCLICLTLAFSAKSADVLKQDVCPKIPRYIAHSIPFNFCGDGSGSDGDSAQAATSPDALFVGGADSVVAIAIGHAEGNRTIDGGKTGLYSGHTDPGNGASNLGTFSWQTGGCSTPEECDKRGLERLEEYRAKLATLEGGDKVLANTEALVNYLDLTIQAPLAAADFPKLYAQHGDILKARVESFRNPATGQFETTLTGNGINTLDGDQKRRMDAIAAVLQRNQDKLKASPTAAAATSSSSDGWINPAPGAVFTSGFGFRNHPIEKLRTCHYGIDLAGPVGSPILAAKSGTVEEARWNDAGFGYMVVIDHGGGVKTLYAHNNELKVSAGQKVSQGDIIALMGSTGNSTGPHLHFEVDLGNGKVDPRPLIPGVVGEQTFGELDPEATKQCEGRTL